MKIDLFIYQPIHKNKLDQKHIYLLRTREFANTNKNIFKIGRTCQRLTDRFRGYPRSTEIWLTRKVTDDIMFENKIIESFDVKFIKRSEIGREYYEGDVYEMMNEINEIYSKNEPLNQTAGIPTIEPIPPHGLTRLDNPDNNSLCKTFIDTYLVKNTDKSVLQSLILTNFTLWLKHIYPIPPHIKNSEFTYNLEKYTVNIDKLRLYGYELIEYNPKTDTRSIY